jgi:hypothetical protein
MRTARNEAWTAGKNFVTYRPSLLSQLWTAEELKFYGRQSQQWLGEVDSRSNGRRRGDCGRHLVFLARPRHDTTV